MINCVDDTLYYSNDDELRKNCVKKLFKKFHLSLKGEAKWYLGVGVVHKKNCLSLD